MMVSMNTERYRPFRRPLVWSYGLGVDSTAGLMRMVLMGDVPDEVVRRFGDYSRKIIDMDADVVLTPSPTFKLSVFRFEPGNLYTDEVGWVVRTRPVTFEKLYYLATGEKV